MLGFVASNSRPEVSSNRRFTVCPITSPLSASITLKTCVVSSGSCSSFLIANNAAMGLILLRRKVRFRAFMVSLGLSQPK